MSQQPVNENTKSIFWIIWGAFLSSQAIYIAVIYLNLINIEKRSVSENIVYSLLFISVLVTIIAEIFYRKASSANKIRERFSLNPEMLNDEKGKQFFSFLICWILTESVSVCGFILSYLGNLDTGKWLFLVGALLLIYRRPKNLI